MRFYQTPVWRINYLSLRHSQCGFSYFLWVKWPVKDKPNYIHSNGKGAKRTSLWDSDIFFCGYKFYLDNSRWCLYFCQLGNYDIIFITYNNLRYNGCSLAPFGQLSKSHSWYYSVHWIQVENVCSMTTGKYDKPSKSVWFMRTTSIWTNMNSWGSYAKL